MSAPTPLRPRTSWRQTSAPSSPTGRDDHTVAGTRRRRRGALVAVLVLGSAAVAVMAVVGGSPFGSPSSPDTAARRAAEHFLDGYLGADGRVVRRDQGGDTVSEGQAYAMLVAHAIGDRRRFDLAWRWARDNLQRPDGLLAWRWADGRVQDDMPAADADLDAAWALMLAAARFDDESLRDDGLRMAAAVLEHETVVVGDGLVLVAGPWARRQPAVVNPSYVSPAAIEIMADQTGDGRWEALGATSRRLLEQSMGPERPLPPDWSHLTAAGTLEPESGPGQQGQGPRYGLDAARLVTRLAPCTGQWRRLAASTWPVLAGSPTAGTALASDLQGGPLEPTPHVAKAVAAAAAAHAAQDPRSRDALLARAERLERESPTYYGAAWLALGRLLLESSLGDGCDNS